MAFTILSMEAAIACGSIGAAMWLCAALVVCHHKHIHSDPRNTETLLPPEQQWFQRDDVCVPWCTHENWAVGFVVIGTAFACSAVILVVAELVS